VRITFLIDGLHVGRGIDVATVHLAEALAERGEKVVVAGADAQDAAVLLARPPEFECVPLPAVPGGVRQRAKGVRHLIPAIEGIPTDCYVPVSFPFDTLGGRLNAPVVLYDHGAVPSRHASPALRMAICAVAGYAILARRRARGVVTISQWLATRMARWMDESRIRVVPNGVDHARRLLEVRLDRSVARRTLGLPAEAPLVLAVARCGPEARYKGLHLLGDALSQRGFQRRGGVFAVVGQATSADRDWLAGHGVTALGPVDESGLASAYAATDLHVSASTFEGFNLPLVEAQWMGVPVAAIDRCAHPEVVASPSTLFPDVPHLADHIVERLLEHPELSRETADAAMFARRFTWDSAAEKFSTALVDLLEEPWKTT
jgi:glycosyltransferase involved in cell wall biosynthesis